MGYYNRIIGDTNSAAPQGFGVTAAAGVSSVNSKRLINSLSAGRSKQWQDEVNNFYHCIGEVRKSSGFVKDTMSQIRYKPALLNDDCRAEPISELDDTVENIINDVVSSINFHHEEFGRGAQNLFLYGEYYIDYYTDESLVGGYGFRVYSYKDIISKNGEFMLTRGRRVLGELIRVWDPSPEDYDSADSAHRSMLDVLRIITLRTEADTRASISFLSNAGLLVAPSVKDDDGRGLEELMGRVADERVNGGDDVGSTVPIVLEYDSESRSQVEYVRVDRLSDADKIQTIVDLYIKRYANNIPIPKEKLLGYEDSGVGGHQGMFVLKEEEWNHYFAPKAKSFAHIMTSLVLRDVLRSSGVEELLVNRIVIVPDATDVITRPDKTDVALRMYDRFGIGPDALRRETGFGEGDRPSDEDLEYMKSTLRKESVPPDYYSVTRNDAGGKEERVVQASSIMSRVGDDIDSLVEGFVERLHDATVSVLNKIISEDVENSFNVDSSESQLLLLEELREYTLVELEELFRQRNLVLSELDGVSLAELDELVDNDVLVSSVAAYLLWVVDFGNRVREADGLRVESVNVTMIQGLLSNSIGGGVEHTVQSPRVSSVDGVSRSAYTRVSGDLLSFSEDRSIREVLTSAGYGVFYEWVRGNPKEPFPPHVRLDGVTWRSESEREELTLSSGDGFGFYYPGDHKGCQCRIVMRLGV